MKNLFPRALPLRLQLTLPFVALVLGLADPAAIPEALARPLEAFGDGGDAASLLKAADNSMYGEKS